MGLSNRGISYTRVGRKKYRLDEGLTFYTPIKGYYRQIFEPNHHRCSIHEHGSLNIPAGFIWDMASGAIDTPDMAIASLAHDALCIMINRGCLPRKEQSTADAYFKQVLKEEGCGWVRRWYSYLVVRAYQTLKR